MYIVILPFGMYAMAQSASISLFQSQLASFKTGCYGLLHNLGLNQNCDHTADIYTIACLRPQNSWMDETQP